MDITKVRDVRDRHRLAFCGVAVLFSLLTDKKREGRNSKIIQR